MSTNVRTARELRKRQTDVERILWLRLRDRRLDGWKFRRQMPVDHFVVDFCCPDAKLIVELDGGQHAVHGQREIDRTQALEAMGYLVLRFWNIDVMRNVDGVLEAIFSALEQLRSEPPHPNPLPNGERERA